MIHITIITKFKGKVASTPPSSQTQHVGWTSDSVPPSGLSKKTSTDKNRDTETKIQKRKLTIKDSICQLDIRLSPTIRFVQKKTSTDKNRDTETQRHRDKIQKRKVTMK